MKLYQKLENEINTRHETKIYNHIKLLQSEQGPIIKINNQDYYNMCSNNYLGFAADEITKKAVMESINKFGVGPGAVRSISGTFEIHRIFEQKLADFKKVESVLVVQSGFQANTALIPAITTADDLVISDELNHASIIDAISLSKTKKVIYKHCDMENLRAILEQYHQEIKGNIFIVTDGVFSMDGDIAPLDQIYILAKEFGAYTIVDDAHGEGVLGEHGRGVVNHFGLEGKIDIEIGTLSKAFGIVGGFIGGKKILIEYLNQKARPFLFSSSLEQSMCSAGIQIIDELLRTDERVQKLWENAKYLQSKFIEDGYSIGDTMTPITPFMVYDEKIATELTKLLFEDNILVSPIIYPTVGLNKGRIRIMVSALHTKEQIDYVYGKIIHHYKTLI
ncbi:MAG: aminotransferase class I/II-fold pyridoxal phosphate-dependent enzyme [Mycoplasmatales bacterium]